MWGGAAAASRVTGRTDGFIVLFGGLLRWRSCSSRARIDELIHDVFDGSPRAGDACAAVNKHRLRQTLIGRPHFRQLGW